VNAWLAQGGEAIGVKAGTAYVDVGTFNGYREAITLLSRNDEGSAAGPLGRGNGHDKARASAASAMKV
jgi:hypothetical protein